MKKRVIIGALIIAIAFVGAALFFFLFGVSYNTSELKCQVGSQVAKYETISYKNVSCSCGEGEKGLWNRRAYIGKLQKLHDRISKYAKVNDTFQMYIEDSLTTQATDGIAYINYDDYTAGTVVSHTAVIMSMCGGNVNYGLAYGMAEHIYGNNSCSSSSVQELISNPEDMYLLYFDMPEFDELIAGNDYTIDNLKAVAADVTQYAINNYGEEYVWNLIVDSKTGANNYEDRYAELINKWKEAYKIEYDFEKRNYTYTFDVNLLDKNNPYTINTKHLMFKCDLNGLAGQSGYKGFMDMLEADFPELDSELEELMGYFNVKAEPIEVDLINDSELSDCNYDGSKINIHYDYTEFDFCIIHEYTHYLQQLIMDRLNQDKMNNWGYEAIAEYMAVYLMNNNPYQNYFKLHDDYYGVYWNDDTQKYDVNIEYEQVAYDFYNGNKVGVEYMPVDEHSKIRVRQKDDVKAVENLQYNEAGYLFKYLVDTYGEERLTQYFETDSSFEDVFGAAFDELYKSAFNVG